MYLWSPLSPAHQSVFLYVDANRRYKLPKCVTMKLDKKASSKTRPPLQVKGKRILFQIRSTDYLVFVINHLH